jgi:hypothetical protein
MYWFWTAGSSPVMKANVTSRVRRLSRSLRSSLMRGIASVGILMSTVSHVQSVC